MGTPSKRYRSPWWVSSSEARPLSRISKFSSKRSRRLSQSTSKKPTSTGDTPAPTPSCRRPSLRWSSMQTSSMSRSG